MNIKDLKTGIRIINTEDEFRVVGTVKEVTIDGKVNVVWEDGAKGFVKQEALAAEEYEVIED